MSRLRLPALSSSVSREFLPAVLEVQHTPPHPMARWIACCLMAVFVFFLLWACYGQVDVVAIAHGKIIPSSRVKHIQPVEKGVVKTLFVQEGQLVKAGDPLVALDRTSSDAEQARVANDIAKMEELLAREQALLLLLDGHEQTISQSPLQQALLDQQWQQYAARLSSLHKQLDSRIAEREVNTALLVKLENTLPIVNKQSTDLQPLVEKKLVAQKDFLEIEEKRISQKQDLAAAHARKVQLDAAIAEAEQQATAHRAETRLQTLTKIADTERQLVNLRQQWTQAKDFDNKQVLYSPVAGQVKDLAIHTVGGVVVEAQLLMLIVPDDALLEAEVWLPNQDIGFVQENDPAVIKIHTFPFTKYGVINATVTNIAHDAIEDKKSAAEYGGLSFRMGLLMAQNSLWVDEREVRLMPGMEVTAEIITGQRRLIEYFLAPLHEHLQESVRER